MNLGCAVPVWAPVCPSNYPVQGFATLHSPLPQTFSCAIHCCTRIRNLTAICDDRTADTFFDEAAWERYQLWKSGQLETAAVKPAEV